LKALATEDGTALRRTEGDRSLFSASRADGLSFHFGVAVILPGGSRASQNRYPLGLAGLATLRFVLELLIVKEKLFPGGENEITATVNTLQHLVLKFH